MFDYIRLKRTMCYGTCPVYNVTVDKEGNVKYEGEMFVCVQKWEVSVENFKQKSKTVK